MKKKKERKKNDEREVLVEAEVGAGLTVETDEGAQEAEIGGMYSKHMLFFFTQFLIGCSHCCLHSNNTFIA